MRGGAEDWLLEGKEDLVGLQGVFGLIGLKRVQAEVTGVLQLSREAVGRPLPLFDGGLALRVHVRI